MKKYDHKTIERKWQNFWSEKGIYATPDKAPGKDNFYLLVEFPYPSGNLHVGHWYAFALPDILARLLRMQGKNVLYPIGFDAFGLPAENAAIKNKLSPRQWTQRNIEHMKKQIVSMGTSFDWSRLISTCDPQYYKWTQWLFLQLFKRGLAYQKNTAVNWCPKDKTVLANEQVINGHCERCETEVMQKEMLQWNLKITNYADRLIDDLEKLDWPEQIKESQKNWIGRSEGAEISFKIAETDVAISVFTTRADTLFGATYLVIAPEHEIVERIRSKIANWKEVLKYINKTKKKTTLDRQMDTREKTGVRLDGIQAINPGNKEKIPIYIADYVLASYGTGAIMSVPAHDKRDFDFAKKFALPITHVVVPKKGNAAKGEVYTDDGELINSGIFSGLTSDEARKKITKALGASKTTYKLRDWIVSRQRYWGVPIPVIHCNKCGAVPVPDSDLPVVLPETEDYLPEGSGKSPLAKVHDWVLVKCPRCGGKGKRETDTLDTFVDSSWYFLRYTDSANDKKFASAEQMSHWMPVDLYSGGAEHTTMHLLYSRFWHKALFDLGLVKDSEPYKRRMNRSLILGPDGQKMSKSRDNVVDPDEVVRQLGADTVRMYLAFIGPYNEVSSYPWNPNGVVGIRRFLERVCQVSDLIAERDVKKLDGQLHKTIKKVGEDILALKFNTAVSALMIFLNEIEKIGALGMNQWHIFLKLLAPFAPHLCEELWKDSGKNSSIHQESWPAFDASMLADEKLTIVVQINGKLRGSLKVSADAGKETVEKLARDIVASRLIGFEISRVVTVPGRLINFVLKQISIS